MVYDLLTFLAAPWLSYGLLWLLSGRKGQLLRR